MAKIDDGGPAFPLPRNHSNGDAIYAPGDGMSLRDYFAAKALCEYLAAHMADDKQVDEDVVADCAYSMADAMLRARTSQSPADVQAQHLTEFGKP